MKTLQRRSLFGIQPSGNIHIGHMIIINRAIELNSKFLVADLHSRTSALKRSSLGCSKTMICQLLALNVKSESIYLQSQTKQIGDLLWYFFHFIKLPQLTRMHLYKQLESQETIYMSEMCYPVLMIIDILLSDCNTILIGEDQNQHIELYNDFVSSTKLGPRVTYEPTNCIIGTDGRKMSKSYNNSLSFFDKENVIRHRIMTMTTADVPLKTTKNRDCPFFDVVQKCFDNTLGRYLYARKHLYRLSFFEEKKLFLHFFLQKSHILQKRFKHFFNNWNSTNNQFVDTDVQQNCYRLINTVKKILQL